MKGKTSNVSVRLADLLPTRIPQDFASNGTRSILDHWQGVTVRNINDCLQVTRHPHLVDAKNGTCTFTDHIFDQRRIHVESAGFYVNEDRDSPTVTNAVGGSDIRMANRNHFIALLHPHRSHRQVERRGAA